MKLKINYTKALVFITGLIFICSVFTSYVLTACGVDISDISVQNTITTGAVFAVSIVGYQKKAEAENLSKGRIKYSIVSSMFELKLKNLVTEEQLSTLKKDMDSVNEALENRADDILKDTLGKEISINDYI